MVDRAPTDFESPTPRTKRRFARLVYVLAVLALLVGAALFIAVKRSSNLDWYVSPPMDKQGRRIHILVPAGWQSTADTKSDPLIWDSSSDGDHLMLIAPGTKKREIPLIQKWLRALHLVSGDEPKGIIAVHTAQNVLLAWDRTQYPKVAVDGEVRELPSPPRGYWMMRAFSIKGADKEVAVNCTFSPKQDLRALARTICSSTYVE